MTGRFIALYGVNNIGKSTQISLLVSALASEGYTVEQRKSPNYELPSGKIINAILREGRAASASELQQWQALNMNQDQPSLREALAEGKLVVTEDYWGTTIAWGLGHGLARADLNAMVDGLPEPDIAILMHGRRFSQAKEAGHAHEENDDLTERVQRFHLELADEFGWRKVDANRPKKIVHQEIMEIINAAVPA
jgi:dTMP kinase